jgi:hypothetical protein
MVMLKGNNLLLCAWAVQFMGTSDRLIDVDGERECLEHFQAGMAGNYQWGLDSRHYDDWNPYSCLPAE